MWEGHGSMRERCQQYSEMMWWCQGTWYDGAKGDGMMVPRDMV